MCVLKAYLSLLNTQIDKKFCGMGWSFGSRCRSFAGTGTLCRGKTARNTLLGKTLMVLCYL
jgi:hypothetical protein